MASSNDLKTKPKKCCLMKCDPGPCVGGRLAPNLCVYCGNPIVEEGKSDGSK